MYDFDTGKRPTGATVSKTTLGSVHQVAYKPAGSRSGLPPRVGGAKGRSILQAADRDDMDDELADFDDDNHPMAQDGTTNNSPSPHHDVSYNSAHNPPRNLINMEA